MRILCVSAYYKPAFVYGGPARCIPSLCEGMARAGAQVTVLTTNANGPSRLEVPLNRPVDVDGVAVTYYPLTLNGLGFFYSRGLAAAAEARVKESDLTLIEALWGHALVVAGTACLDARIPYVVQLHGQMMPWALRQKSAKKRLYLALVGRRYLDHAAGLQCTDRAEADAVAPLNLHAPAFVVPNGVDTSVYARLPERGAVRRRFGIPERAVVLLVLGRLTQVKRPDIAIGVAAAVRAAGYDAHLVFAGPDEGVLIPGLREMAQSSGCSDRVHFTGLLNGDETLQALADADLLLMPSEVQENFGMAALEALAAGVPILVSGGVPVGRWALAAGAGRVAPCTTEAFARAGVELLSDPARLREMGRRARELARRRFDHAVVTGQLLAQYQAIVSHGRPLPDTEDGEVTT